MKVRFELLRRWVVRLACVALSVAAATAAAGEDVSGPASLPGAPPFPPALLARLDGAVREKGADYVPRTRHKHPNGSAKYTNRLILEASPYLLQHAHNPVNWYPWGDDAFESARRKQKPVLLSIGYSTCHWCHVMEEESFEDEEIAAFLNEHYVAIKVDREQRPDVDAVYMAAVQVLTGNGGWPMTVWLTPDRKPFHGGTYFPPRDGERGYDVGFLTLLRRVRSLYDAKPQEIATAAGEIVPRAKVLLGENLAGTSVDGAQAMHAAVASFRQRYDAQDGGFFPAPKFPRSVALEFLLRYQRRTGDASVLRMVTRTLEAMAAGGIYDHAGGGFHRYSTDVKWLVPHFEKMIYDNAQLAVIYLEAYQATGREDFARVAREVLRYIGREMTSPAGAFYSATDADSEGEEGTFYVWTPDEIRGVLGPARATWFARLYGVTDAGNFEGKNILHLALPMDEAAAQAGMKPADFRNAVEKAKAELYEARKQRVAPLSDRKIIVSWNGLAISAFARAALVLDDAAFRRQAVRAAEFLLANMKDGERLRRSYLDGRAEGTGYLDDYAFLTQALLDLYEADYDPRWLQEAIALQRVLKQRFWDDVKGGYFLTADDAEALFMRAKPSYDGAEPSGNSIAILNLLRLAEFTTADGYRAMADQALGAFGAVIKGSGASVPKMLNAVDFRADVPKEIILVKPDAGADAGPLLAELRKTFLPNRILAIVAEGPAQQRLDAVVPLAGGKVARGGAVTAYVCERQVCKLPTTRPNVFAAQLSSIEPLALPLK